MAYFSIYGCARCGGDHPLEPLLKFRRPPTDGDGVWAHWATCPTTGDPILVQIREPADGAATRGGPCA